mmetsp:Transcript_10157/g.24957  ORF Transcript_10157/g.24957 Transcript_10157/m.24957 type:complete len:248 (-) Transcript_10157:838-1581(-)
MACRRCILFDNFPFPPSCTPLPPFAPTILPLFPTAPRFAGLVSDRLSEPPDPARDRKFPGAVPPSPPPLPASFPTPGTVTGRSKFKMSCRETFPIPLPPDAPPGEEPEGIDVPVARFIGLFSPAKNIPPAAVLEAPFSKLFGGICSSFGICVLGTRVLPFASVDVAFRLLDVAAPPQSSGLNAMSTSDGLMPGEFRVRPTVPKVGLARFCPRFCGEKALRLGDTEVARLVTPRVAGFLSTWYPITSS